MFLYIRKYEIWFFVEIFTQKLIHMNKPQTPPPPYVDLCGYFTNPLPPPSRSTWFVDVPLLGLKIIFNLVSLALDMITQNLMSKDKLEIGEEWSKKNMT